jgi:acyl-CoA dehydrogenase
MPFMAMVHGAAALGLADGPTEVHKTTVAKQVLREYKASEDIWPSEWIPRKREAAKEKFAEYLEHEVGNL